MSHTPGPWRLVPPPTADNGNPWRVAGCDHTIAIIPNRPREADARLIAAAPDMLAALKIARQYVKATHGSLAGAVGPDNLVSPDLALIDTAVAKAEGTA